MPGKCQFILLMLVLLAICGKICNAASYSLKTIAGKNGISSGSVVNNIRAASTWLQQPRGVYVDSSSNIFIAMMPEEFAKSSQQAGILLIMQEPVRQLIHFKVLDILRQQALLWGNLHAVTGDSKGSIYIADYECSRIYKVVLSGTLSLLPGLASSTCSTTNAWIYSGNGGQATSASSLCRPTSFSVTTVYIADKGSNLARSVFNSIISLYAGDGTSTHIRSMLQQL